MSNVMTSCEEVVVDFIKNGDDDNHRRQADSAWDLARRISKENQVFDITMLHDTIVSLRGRKIIRCRGNGYYSVPEQE